MSERIKSSREFINLHSHTGLGSVWDAIDLPDKHMNAVWDGGMDAMAITEHGNANSVAYAVHHRNKMLKEGKQFKYILGCENYFLPSIKEWRREYEEWKIEKEKSKKKSDLSEEYDGTESDHLKGILKGKSHLVLLAQNQEGLNNLYSLISLSNSKENFYRKPRIDFEMLRKYNKGLLCSTACLSGYISMEYLKNKNKNQGDQFEHLSSIVQKFLDIFGDRFYGELQWNAIREQHEINQVIISLSQKFGFDLVSTNDSHYPKRNSWKDREIYKRLGWMGKITDKPHFTSANEDGLPQSIDDLKYELYPRNGDEMWKAYKDYSKKCNFKYDDEVIAKSLSNTCKIAYERVEDFEVDKTIRLPNFVKEKDESPEYTLSKLAIQGLKKLGLDKKKEYVDRLKREIKIIQKKNFSQYFLTMKQVVDFASKDYLTGVSRGSAGGSLLSYCLGITQIDPIEWKLQFERFLSEHQESFPDIDVDFESPMELKQKMMEKWGENSVVPVSNFMTLQMRSLIKDVSKFYDIPYQEVNDVTSKMLIEATPQSKKDHDIVAGVYIPTFEELKKYSKTFQKFIQKYPKVADHLEALEGQIRQISRHASGCIIGESLDKYMPLIRSGDVLQTPWPEGQTIRLLEPMGFIKFDILGLASLRMMRQAIHSILKNHFGIENPSFEEIKKFYDENVHPNKLNFSDEKIYRNVFHEGRFHNVFQFQEKGVQNFCKLAKPNSIEDITIVTSTYRPGPLSSSVDKKYIEAKENPESIEYVHPFLKEILGPTFGNLIFQEQIASIVHKMGKNVSLEEGNQLRKLLVKRGDEKSGNKKEKIHKKYTEGCLEKGLTIEQSNEIWDAIEKSNSYLFNKSHGLAYSVISFQCAFFLTYYPTEWACAFLEKDSEFETKKEKAIASARQMGYDIEEANINTSTNMWEKSKVKENTIVQPLTSLKGIGNIAIDYIIKNRPYNTIEDLIFNPEIPCSKVNKRCLEILIKSQTLNHLMDKRFNNLKHFFLSVCEKRPSNPQELELNILMHSSVMDFSEEEKIEFSVEYTGIFPMEKVMSQQLLKRLDEKCIPPISEHDEQLRVCWAIPREVEKKTTSKGKDYYNVVLIDSNFGMTKLRCWGINAEKDKLYINRPYMISPKSDSVWGMSTNGPLFKSWKLLG